MIPNLISILIPCYNQGHFLNETLQSILNQTYTNWECIVIDDGSPDNTKDIVANWKKKDNRFIYLEKANGGRSSARNLGLDTAKGEFIQFLDADDFLHHEKFEKSMKLFRKENSDIVITNFLRFRKSTAKVRRAFCQLEEQQFNFETILMGWDIQFSIPIHCGIFKHSLIESIRFNLKLNAYEDWFFWLEFYKNANKTSFINENLALYRMNPKGTTINFEHMQENLCNAYFLIYNTLDENHKQKFFERIIKELAYSKREYKKFKDSIFYRKIFYKIKKLF